MTDLLEGTVPLVRRSARSVAGRDRLGHPRPVGSYRTVFNTMVPDAVQIADPFHVCRVAKPPSNDRRDRLMGLLAAGDPRGQVKLTWHAKEVVRQIYDHTDPQLAEAWVDEIIRDFTDREMPLEVRRLGRTIKRWRDQIVAWHRSHVSDGPTEAINNLIKRVKRVAFGMRRFRNYRIRALLYAGRPNWELLDSLTPP